MKRILVIDDDDSVVQLVENMLLDEHCEILGAANGFEALDRIRTSRPSLILVDLNMPWIDGLDICRLLRRLPNRTTARIVLVTGSRVDDRAARKAGADSVLEKPFSREAVLALLSETPDATDRIQR